MKKIDAVEMVRNIRDKQNKDTSGKSPNEMIDYFRRKAMEIAEKAGVPGLSGRTSAACGRCNHWGEFLAVEPRREFVTTSAGSVLLSRIVNRQSRIYIAHNSLLKCSLCLIMVFGLVSCGNSNSMTDASCTEAQHTITGDIPNSVDLITSDMTLPHEGAPHGVPKSYDWAKVPTTHAQSIPDRFHAMVAWGQVYEDSCGNPASNTRVQIHDIRAYMLSKKDHQWHLLQESQQVDGAAYLESFVPPVNKPGDIRHESDGSISVKAGGGFNFHFFTPSRAEIDPSDVAAIWTTVQARLLIDDPALPDDRFKAHYLLNMGADLWRNTTVDFDKEENNPDLGVGRFKYVTTGWQSFNMLYMEGGIDGDALRENPPPINTNGG